MEQYACVGLPSGIITVASTFIMSPFWALRIAEYISDVSLSPFVVKGLFEI